MKKILLLRFRVVVCVTFSPKETKPTWESIFSRVLMERFEFLFEHSFSKLSFSSPLPPPFSLFPTFSGCSHTHTHTHTQKKKKKKKKKKKIALFCFSFPVSSQGLEKIGRPSLDVSFVLDVSGSMSCSFPDPNDHRSKLSVATDCLTTILGQLREHDTVGVVSFNTQQRTIAPLKSGIKSYREEVVKKLGEIDAGGGTDLSGGLLAGLEMVAEGDGENKRMKRVIFLTDMGLVLCFFCLCVC